MHLKCFSKFRQLLSLPDGGVLALDWVDKLEPHVDKPDTPVLLVMPGLSGNCNSSILQAACNLIQQTYQVLFPLYRVKR